MSNPTTNTNMNQYTSSKAADPETASIATVSSTTPLVKKDKKEKEKEQKQKKETEIDAQKLQEQALRSQVRFTM